MMMIGGKNSGIFSSFGCIMNPKCVSDSLIHRLVFDEQRD